MAQPQQESLPTRQHQVLLELPTRQHQVVPTRNLGEQYKITKMGFVGQHQVPPRWDNPSCPKATSSSLFKDKPTIVPNPNPKTSQVDP
jgi:hypothetical protein